MAAKRRKDPLWARLILIFGVVLVVVSGGTLVAAQTVINQAESSITQGSLLEGDAAAADGESGNNIDGAVNLLLVGIDAREEGSSVTSVLSDTIIILHIPETHDQAYLISIPRDWRVEMPAYDKVGFVGATGKINSAFSYGYEGDGTELEKRSRGMAVLSNTLNKITGIRFNGAAIIDFNGFASLIHAMGGVDMCVDEAAESAHLGVDANGKLVQGWYSETYGIQLPEGVKPLVHEKGCRLMNSTEALDYARIRKSLSDGDYGRQRHQQQLIKAIAKKATSSGVLTDLGKLNDLTKAAGEAFVLDTGGIAPADFIFTLKGVAANDLMLIKTNAGNLNSVTIDGQSFEQLDGESMDMLAAAKSGTLGTFLIEHPQFIAKSS
ncbi:LCP family protein required for cell wall assembly [Catenuloplanes nepalensis]|uniref:LCP family protein required for cell wall assembly n=1 Tax=Catenuloplanes nepalensis TaxID=587533 RepID=A0ABT9N4G9_9ACTN|nr:LCP family protein [Catenuloplanes nepalensis]MDP9798587.1 LCP family protein required for cell wall assembly [Catenuloplanes nepalensis]